MNLFGSYLQISLILLFMLAQFKLVYFVFRTTCNALSRSENVLHNLKVEVHSHFLHPASSPPCL